MSVAGNGTLGKFLSTTTNVGATDADYTIAFWILPVNSAPPAGDGFQTAVAYGDSGGINGNEFYFDQAPNFLQPHYIQAPSDTLIGGGVYSTTVMTFTAIVHTAAAGGSTTIYRGNGNAALTTTVVAGATPTVPTQKFQLFNEINTPNEPLNGSLLAVRVWSAALGVDEVQIEYQGGCKPKTRLASLARFHPLLNVTNDTVDWSGNAFSLTATGTLLAGTAAPPISWGAPPLL